MIEMRTVTDSNRFTYNNEKTQKGENNGAVFSELVMNTGIETTDSQSVSAGYEENSDELLPESNLEVVTYTFLGKKSLFGKFTGRNLDFEI